MKVAIVNGICKRHDAVSDSILAMIAALGKRFGARCRLYAYACDYDTIDFMKVENAGQILIDPFFLSADLIIYHYAIYYDLFDAVLLGNGRARQAVFYHNITPARFLPPAEKRLIEKSERQLINASAADEIWAASGENVRHLGEIGLGDLKSHVISLSVKTDFSSANLFKRREGDVRAVYVGRFVESKGLTDLISAVARARETTDAKFTLELIGNQQFSDGRYITRLRTLIAELGLNGTVVMAGELTDAELNERLLAADIYATCSYHEGFCVPLIEAMNAGVVPIAYAAGNIPWVVKGCGELVATGDWRQFGDRLGRLVGALRRAGGGRTVSPSDIVEINGEAVSFADLNRRTQVHLRDFTFDAFEAALHTRVSALLRA